MVKHPTMPRVAPYNKELPVHSVNNVDVDKPCSRSRITKYFNSKSPLKSAVATASVFFFPFFFLKKDFEAIFNYKRNNVCILVMSAMSEG